MERRKGEERKKGKGKGKRRVRGVGMGENGGKEEVKRTRKGGKSDTRAACRFCYLDFVLRA
jgi:hypothetical protein